MRKLTKELLDELYILLSDEDLTDEKLWEASGELLPSLADAINKDLRKKQQDLKDHFAGLAMQGLVTALTSPLGYENTTTDLLAKEAYSIADAMLKARKESNND